MEIINSITGAKFLKIKCILQLRNKLDLSHLGIETQDTEVDSYNLIDVSKIVGFEKTASMLRVPELESESQLTETEVFCEGGVCFVVNETLENIESFLTNNLQK